MMATGILKVKGEQLVDGDGEVLLLRGAGRFSFVLPPHSPITS